MEYPSPHSLFAIRRRRHYYQLAQGRGQKKERSSLPEKRLLQNRRPQRGRPRYQLTRPQRKKAKGIGLVQEGGEVGGRVLPKEDFDPEILNFLKVS